MSKSTKIIILILFSLILSFLVYFLIIKANKKPIKLSDLILSPQSGVIIKYGENKTIELNPKTLANINSLKVLHNNKELEINKPNKTIDISAKNLTLGVQNLIISFEEKKKVKKLNYVFTVVSDLSPKYASYNVLKKLNHDPNSYTQGLELHDQTMFESGGLHGKSFIRKYEWPSGKIIKNVALDAKLFGEGLTKLDDKIYQLTYQEGKILIYDKDLNLINTQPLQTSSREGWGLSNDGSNLIVTDGTNKLIFLDPTTFAISKILPVYAAESEINYINELEYVDGFLYANVYTTNNIVRIEASTGRITHVYDLSALKSENNDGEVLNGIAYNKANKTFIVTGKNWKYMYEVKLEI